MSDLISREAVIKAMENNSFMVEAFGTKRKMIDGMMMCVEIADLPTVEAKEVVHGEWVRTKFASEYICSNCQALTYAELTRTGYKNFNFCPNCGADMRTSAE